MLEKVIYNGKEYAIIIRKDYHAEGITFFTQDNYSQQMAYMHHSEGKIIDAHVHNHESRNVFQTQEVLIIRKGKMRVDFYQQDQVYFGSKIVEAGDVLLLAFGGHGFEVIEEIEMIEIKQGPYLGERDKIRFEGISADSVMML